MHTVEGKSPKEIIRWLFDNKHLGFNEMTSAQINNITIFLLHSTSKYLLQQNVSMHQKRK